MRTSVLLFSLLLLSTINCFSQGQNITPEIRISIMNGLPRLNDQHFEIEKYDADRTSILAGFDLKLIFPSGKQNMQWISGAFYQQGEDWAGSYDEARTVIGALYFGPQLSTSCKFINFSAYVSAALCSVSDEVLVTESDEIVYSSISNYTAPGTKAGLNLSFHLGKVNLVTGYQAFMTAGKNSANFYHGIEAGLGVHF